IDSLPRLSGSLLAIGRDVARGALGRSSGIHRPPQRGPRPQLDGLARHRMGPVSSGPSTVGAVRFRLNSRASIVPAMIAATLTTAVEIQIASRLMRWMDGSPSFRTTVDAPTAI